MDFPTISYEEHLRSLYETKSIESHRKSLDPLIGRFSFSPQKVKKLSKHNREFIESKKQVSQLQQMIITSTSSKLEAFITEEKMLFSLKRKITNSNLNQRITQQKPIPQHSQRDHQNNVHSITSNSTYRKSMGNIQSAAKKELLSCKGTLPKVFPIIDSNKISVKSDSFKKKLIKAKYSNADTYLKSNQQVDLPKLNVVLKVEQPLMSYDKRALDYFQRYKDNTCLQVVAKIQNKKAITAKNHCVMNIGNMKIIIENNSAKLIEVASLTKIMTCYLTILLCYKYSIDKTKLSYRVPDKITEVPGTSAFLQAGDILSVQELLYGLMLPSGNDAAVCLSECIGKIIVKNQQKSGTYQQAFIQHMNLLAKQMQLEQVWNNCTGLAAYPNYTTAKAMISLTAVALQNEEFAQIVQTKQMELMIRNDRYGLKCKKIWQNTNRLLWKGFVGVKTGTTQSAGPCLMSCKDQLLIGVFNCQTSTKRFSETIKLYQFCKDKTIM